MLGTKKMEIKKKKLTSCPKDLLSNGRNNQGSNGVNSVKVIPSTLLEQRRRNTYLRMEVSERVSQK